MELEYFYMYLGTVFLVAGFMSVGLLDKSLQTNRAFPVNLPFTVAAIEGEQVHHELLLACALQLAKGVSVNIQQRLIKGCPLDGPECR